MNEIKEFQQNMLNQTKYLHDNANDNVVSIQKKMIQQNPFTSMRYTWQEAQMRKAFVFWCTLPFVIGETYMNTFYEVYRQPEATKKEENQ